MAKDRTDQMSSGAESAPRPRVVVVGAGFGGLSAAKKLVRAPVHVTVIDRRNHHLFQPLLYQVATAALSPADIAVPIRAVPEAGRRPHLDVLLDEAVGVDLERRCVLTGGGNSRPYDYLILATGSEYSYFGHDDWAAAAPGLKSLSDAREIRERILLAFERAETAADEAERRWLMTFVVVGGGPTGVETAGAIAELAKASLVRDFSNIDPRSARVVLVEATDRLLAGFSEEQSRYALGALGKLGVEVMLGTPVGEVDPSGVTVGDLRVPSANVLWCAGVAASPVGQWLGARTARNGAVEVEPDLSLPGRPEVFVIGDAASLPGPDGHPLPALAPVAKQEGAHVADVIARRVRGQAAPGPFRYRDWGTMATIGRDAAVGKFGRFEVSGFFAWILWGAVHIGYLVGFRNRLAVMLNWLWSWATYGKGARVITREGALAAKNADGAGATAGRESG